MRFTTLALLAAASLAAAQPQSGVARRSGVSTSAQGPEPPLTTAEGNLRSLLQS